MRLTFVFICLFASVSAGATTLPFHVVHFTHGASALTESEQLSLDQALALLRPGDRIELYGHTDNSGSAAANRALSQQRTTTVQSYCQQLGIHVQRAESLGEDDPIASNQTADGKAQNRRVELWLLPRSFGEENNAGSNAAALDRLFASLSPKPQSFEFKSNVDTLLQCKDGSMVFVPAGAIKGAFEGMNVTVEVVEALDRSDMVLAALNTKSGDLVLESAGMIQIRAFQSGRELSLKPGSDLNVFLPTEQDLDEMQVFYADANLDWKIDTTQTVRRFVPTNLRTYHSYNRPVVKVQPCPFFWCRVNRAFRRSLSNEQTRPGRNRKNQRVKSYKTEGFYITNPALAAVYGSEALVQIDRAAEQKAEMRSTSFAAFSVARLGWINCDRFERSLRQTTPLVAIGDQHVPTYSFLVYERMKSVLPVTGIRGVSTFQNVAVRQKVKVISVRMMDGSPELASASLKVSKGEAVHLTYVPVSQAELESNIQELLD